ncbi:MAG: protein kinase [Sandaracinaceae bacterium]|nr:protein kinase [Sandaracinaceae bacterium]
MSADFENDQLDPLAASASQIKRFGGLQAGTVLGNYTIVRMIGEGGVGAVWEATHKTLAKRVALKTLKPEYAIDADMVTRFVREGRAAARIRHPNVVDVADVGIADGVPYLVMDYLEGQSLASRIATEGAISVKEAANIAVPILVALQAAHDEGIVHRDIKPENIFLTLGRDGKITPMLLDFGISKLSNDDANLTQSASFVGTPYYMSPEQANDSKRVDARTDVYSMGIVLYEMLSARRPYDGDSLIMLVRKICDGECAPLEEIMPDIPMELATIVRIAMRTEASLRFDTALEFASAILPFAGSAVRASFSRVLGYAETSDASALRSVVPMSMRRDDTGKVRPDATGRNVAIGYARTRNSAAMSIDEFADTDPTSTKLRSRRIIIGASATALVIAVGALVWALMFRNTDESPSAVRTDVSSTAPAPPQVGATAAPNSNAAASAVPAPTTTGQPAQAEPSQSTEARSGARPQTKNRGRRHVGAPQTPAPPEPRPASLPHDPTIVH